MLFVVSSASAEIEVYDYNDNYLGILADIEEFNSSGTYYGFYYNIFVPSVSATIRIVAGYLNGIIQPPLMQFSTVYYDNVDCTGNKYVCARPGSVHGIHKQLALHLQDGLFYVSDLDNYSASVSTSSLYQGNGLCATNPNVLIANCYPLVEVTAPFATPIQFPLKMKNTLAGDINGDGFVGLSEAIHALQVVSGK